MTYNTELETCLIAIARKYTPHLIPDNWRNPGDLSQSMPEFINALLAQGVLIVIGDTHGHNEDTILEAVRDCAARYHRLHQFLAARLFPYTYSGTEIRVALCQETDFVVLALSAPVGPIVEAIDQLVTPFIIRNHAPPPGRPALIQLAMRVLQFLESDQDEAVIAGEIADIVWALCIMALRPLPFLPAHSLQPPPTLPEFEPESNQDEAVAETQEAINFDLDTGTSPAQDGGTLAGPIPHWEQSL